MDLLEPKIYHTCDLDLSTGGLYVGGLIDVGIGPQRHGQGKRYYKDKKTLAYEGSYNFGKWHGSGKRFAGDGRLIYDGEFFNDLYHGKGKLFGENGSYYDGEWKNGLKHGYGVHVKQNGEKYTGNWKNGNYDGDGQLFNRNGKIIFKGTHKDGVKNQNCYYFKEDTGEVYEGEYVDGRLHGEATYTDGHGNKYKGSWYEGRKHGYGIYTSPDGSKYCGQWKHDVKDGDGEDTDTDGFTLKGNFRNGYLENDGILFYPNKGIAYEGEFKRSRFHGLGEAFRGDGMKVYSGTFKHGKYDGYGNFYMENEGYYYGYWKDGLRHTGNGEKVETGLEDEENDEEEFKSGEFRDQNGWVYYGEWIHDKRHGKGKLYDENGHLVFDGQFVSNVVNGAGQHYYTSTMMGGSDFKGTFVDGRKEGFGTLTYRDGTVLYKGIYKKDQWHGEGEWQDLYGTWYKGEFENGRRTGDGEIQLSNGDFYKGSFENGKFHGKGVLVKRNTVCDGYFENGKYLESDTERAERLKLEEEERQRRQRQIHAVRERARLRDEALRRREAAQAKAIAQMASWGTDSDVEDINESNARISAEIEKKRKKLEVEKKANEKARIQMEAKIESPEVKPLPSIQQQARMDMLAKRSLRAIKRKRIPRKHGKGISEAAELKKIARQPHSLLPSISP